MPSGHQKGRGCNSSNHRSAPSVVAASAPVVPPPSAPVAAEVPAPAKVVATSLQNIASESSDGISTGSKDSIGRRAGQLASEEVAISALKYAIPVKNILSCYLLGPVLFGECKSERVCVPVVNFILLVLDVTAFSGHLLLGLRRQSYRERVPTYNFYMLLVFWSIWNLCSHPLCRQHVVDLFIMPPEIHVMINIIAIGVCSSKIMAPPSMRHLIGLVTLEFLISLLLSWVEVMNFSIDSGWLAVARLDIVMFNVTILLIGSTILLGTMTVEKDMKSLALDLEHRLCTTGTFEEDLERRKRAVLTALCDAVLTTNSSFVVSGIDDGSEKLFRRLMMNETLTDYFKHEADKESFLAAVKRQFPDDDSVGEGPKRMRVIFRDSNNEPFEADVVVSDASIDANGKVSKFMVGIHARGDHRARMDPLLQKQKPPRNDKLHAPRTPAALPNEPGEKKLEQPRELPHVGAARGSEERIHAMYDELSRELLMVFEETLRLPPPTLNGHDHPQAVPVLGSTVADGSRPAPPCSEEGDGDTASSEMNGCCEGGAPPAAPRFILRRASCEVLRRRASPLVSRAGDKHLHLALLTPVT